MVDVTHFNALAQSKAVMETLEEINATQIPILTVLNEIDLLPSPTAAREALEVFPGSVAISALTGEGVQEFLEVIESLLYKEMAPIRVRLPYDKGDLISIFHDQGQIIRIEHGRGGVIIDGHIPGRLMTRYQPYIVPKDFIPED